MESFNPYKLMQSSLRTLRQLWLKKLAIKFSKSIRFDGSTILIIAPHADDEVFGCGGLIAKTISTNKIVVVVLTDGSSSHRSCCNFPKERISDQRKKLARNAASTLGYNYSNLYFLDWEDGKLPHPGDKMFNSYAEKLADLIRQFRPDSIFYPHPFEGWNDHIAAEELSKTALRKVAFQVNLFHYCVWFWLSMPLRKSIHVRWRDAKILDISDVFEKKQAAIRDYIEPCAPCGKPWSGMLPNEFLNAFSWNRELFFEVQSS